MTEHDPFSEEPTVEISKDLDERRKRWRFLAQDEVWLNHESFRDIKISNNLNRYETAAFYIRDALHGCKVMVHIKNQKQLEAAKLSRSVLFKMLFNIMCFVQVILPFIEKPIGWECSQTDLETMNSKVELCTPTSSSLQLHIGYLPTMLGSSILELFFCLFYLYEIHILMRIRDKKSRRSFFETNGWASIRLICALLMIFDIIVYIYGRYLFAGTKFSLDFFRWSRLLSPIVYISYHQYLRLFVKGFAKIIPRLFTIGIVATCVICFYGFVGYIAYHGTGADRVTLASLPLFSTLPGSFLATLRLFTALAFLIDFENLYVNSPGIHLYCISYVLITAVCLKALVTSVANKLFQVQNQEEFNNIMKQKAWALMMAFTCLANGNGMIEIDEWTKMMKHLRQNISQKGCEMLFRIDTSGETEILDTARNECDRAKFYEICALAEANVGTESDIFGNIGEKVSSSKLYTPVSEFIQYYTQLYLDVKIWKIRFRTILHDTAVILQAVQIVNRSLDSTSESAGFSLYLGNSLISFFWFDAICTYIGNGKEWIKKDWQWQLGICLNILGTVDMFLLWNYGEKLFLVLMSLRLLNLWATLHRLLEKYSDVVIRLGLVLPSLMRCMVVILSVIYSFSLVAYGLLWCSAVGVAIDSPLKTDPMIIRFESNIKSIGYESFTESYITMVHVSLIGAWTLVMDGASLSLSWIALSFFYTYRILMFYFVQPALLGFIVQSWRNLVISTPSTPALKRISKENYSSLPGSSFKGKRNSMAERLRHVKEEEEGRIVHVAPKQRAMSIRFWSTEHTEAMKSLKGMTKDERIKELESELEYYKTKYGIRKAELKHSAAAAGVTGSVDRAENGDAGEPLMKSENRNYGST